MTFRRKYFFEHSKKHLGETQTYLKKLSNLAKQKAIILNWKNFFLEAYGFPMSS